MDSCAEGYGDTCEACGGCEWSRRVQGSGFGVQYFFADAEPASDAPLTDSESQLKVLRARRRV